MGACHKLLLSKGPPSPCPRAQKLYWHEAALPKHSMLSNSGFKSPPRKSGCWRSSGELGCGVPQHASGCSTLAPGGLLRLGTTPGLLPALPVQGPPAGIGRSGDAFVRLGAAPCLAGAWGEIPGSAACASRSRSRLAGIPAPCPRARSSCGRGVPAGKGLGRSLPRPPSPTVRPCLEVQRHPPLQHLHWGKCESDHLVVATGLMFFSWVSAGVKFLRHMQKSFLDCKAKGERRHSAQLLHSSPAWEGKHSPEVQSRSGTLLQEGKRLLFTPKPCSIL